MNTNQRQSFWELRSGTSKNRRMFFWGLQRDAFNCFNYWGSLCPQTLSWFLISRNPQEIRTLMSELIPPIKDEGTKLEPRCDPTTMRLWLTRNIRDESFLLLFCSSNYRWKPRGRSLTGGCSGYLHSETISTLQFSCFLSNICNERRIENPYKSISSYR